MTFLPLRHTVQHLPYAGKERNSRGNTVDVWGDPVDVAVYGWHTGETIEPQIAGHERVRHDARILAPPSFRPGPKDKVILPVLGEFEVEGETEDFNHGPFGWEPGNAIGLRKVYG